MHREDCNFAMSINGTKSMHDSEARYIAIDLKSFYASVECVERGLNALDVCLVVADSTRTNKTICLAVSPALKAFGVPGRPRLFEVEQIVRDVNRHRGRMMKSTSGAVLARNPHIAVDYIVATPRMQLYLDYSARIYEVYLQYVAPEDIFAYSIDEVFIDAAPYRMVYKMSTHELAMHIIRDVLATTGITATVGIGSNMYLSKVAMDIMAKKMPPDKDGVRIAELDEMSYREHLWTHKPLTDFWRVGPGIARKLERAGIHTMGDLARASIKHEDWLYAKFGINAELLIDHAWGWEPVTMRHVKAYRPATHSMSNGQVLSAPYSFSQARTVIREMADCAVLDLVDKRMVTKQLTVTVGYDSASLTDPDIRSKYHGGIKLDHYGRPTPVHSHGTSNLPLYTSSGTIITRRIVELFDAIANRDLLFRRLNIAFHNLVPEDSLAQRDIVQLDLFTDYATLLQKKKKDAEELAKERRRQEAIIELRKRFGKNAILRGTNFADGATQRERNQQIGGHKA